ncbi:hypothetical protein D3X11_03275 [Streptococcus sp. X16XC17]|uniref:hypothetical protein n=1 Tax=Streptococcus sp. X16XC17 TaxID=2316646 RepID=UPI00066FD274|nr:hypothetical protein [Streptococcus sp. X16XC17]TCD46441.1 hypothetical protein D3X11_03275 [Streptococcus sp. X16XC17]
MIKKEHKKLIIDIGLGLVLSIVMPLTALLSTWEAFLQGFVVAFVAGYTVVEMTPVLRWSDQWSAPISGNPLYCQKYDHCPHHGALHRWDLRLC